MYQGGKHNHQNKNSHHSGGGGKGGGKGTKPGARPKLGLPSTHGHGEFRNGGKRDRDGVPRPVSAPATPRPVAQILNNPVAQRPKPATPSAPAAPVDTVLPVLEGKNDIVRMVAMNHACVIISETGSGKTTQIPQFILDRVKLVDAEGKPLMVACTQPRRVAAVSIARYVASQRNCKVGEEVGYSVRFDDQSSPKTKLKFMTDGILLRELLQDPKLSKYGAIILDEAHERTLHGDVLFGLLKALTRERKDLKIIVMSATLNAKHFSNFWRNAPIGIVHGRSHPVTLMHCTEPQADYVDGAINTILQIHVDEPEGDILCFLTGQEEIEDAKRVLESRKLLLPRGSQQYEVLPLYAAMPYEKQLLVFEKAPDGHRKIILATNIAETSITIEGIKYVVDSGMVKSKAFNPKTNMESLQETVISRAQATQRAGRAGRMSAGKCYRLYTEEAFDNLSPETIPEIKRCSLNSVVLQMKAMGIQDPLSFEFMDMPPADAIVKAQEVLALLGALDQGTLCITPLGRRLADFPIEPQAAKTLLAAQALGVCKDAVIVIAMLSTENIFASGGNDGSDKCRAQFAKAVGDHVTLLHVFNAYRSQAPKNRKTWCESNSINYRQIQKAEDVVTQLTALMSLKPMSKEVLSGLGSIGGTSVVSSAPVDTGDSDEDEAHRAAANESKAPKRKNENFTDHECLRKAFCCGYFLNTAFFDPKLQNYRTLVGHQPVHLHPGSVIFFMTKTRPPLVMFNSVVQTSRRYMKDVVIIRDQGLMEAAPQFFQTAQ